MSFRAEVRSFMKSVLTYVHESKKHELIINSQREMLRRLEKQNIDLMDRFMSRNFQEKQVFSIPTAEVAGEVYDPHADEDNAGEVLEN